MGALACGIDFGTTNSVVSLASSDGEVFVLPVSPDRGPTEPPTTMPSCVYLSRSGLREAGEDALELHFTNMALGRLIFGIKSYLSDPGSVDAQIMGRTTKISEVLSVIFHAMKSAVDQAAGADVRRAIVGYPVVFPGAEGAGFRTRQGVAMERTIQAARLAGFDDVKLLSEAEAAGDMIDLGGESARVMALDFGGGTFDAAIIDHTQTSRRVLASNGATVGGEEIDAEIFRRIVAPRLGMEAAVRTSPPVLPNRWYNMFSSKQRLMSLRDDVDTQLDLVRARSWASEGSDRPGMEGLLDLLSLLEEDGMLGLYRSIAAAKAELTKATSTKIKYRVFGSVNRSIPFTRQQLDSLLEPYLRRVEHCIASTLRDAKCAAGDVDAVVLTGGSAQLGAFQDLVDSMFPTQGIAEADAFEAVSAGLGFRCFDEWGAMT